MTEVFRASDSFVDFVHFLFWHNETGRVVSFDENTAWMLAFPGHSRNAQQSGTRTRSLVFEYEYHRKRLSTSTKVLQIKLYFSGSIQAVARLRRAWVQCHA